MLRWVLPAIEGLARPCLSGTWFNLKEAESLPSPLFRKCLTPLRSPLPAQWGWPPCVLRMFRIL